MRSPIAPRWRKLARDLWKERGRTATMVAAIAASLVAVGSVLGAYAVLTREIRASYLGTRPASATLELAEDIGADLVAEVRSHPLVAQAEAREVILARTRVGDEWRRTLLFVIDDFAQLRLNRFRPQAGAWPPPEGEVLVERSAVQMLATSPGQSILIKPPHAPAREVLVAGLVHDPGLAPAWQERSGYVYLSRATLARLGEPVGLHELRVELVGQPTAPAVVEAQSKQLAAWLTQAGHPVHEIRIPPPAQHPHQRQMTTILLMMLGFGVLSLCLSAILVATAVAAMLARQVREIGIMKAMGARAGQIAGLYLGMVGGLGLLAVVLAAPLARVGAGRFARAISTMLNFDLHDAGVPFWVLGVELVSGLLLPLLLAAVPVARASRRTVRQAIDDHGLGGESIGARWALLPRPLRNLLRRPARMLLTMGLLAAGGAMFMTALDVEAGWRANLDKVYATRSYDVEVQLQRDADPALLRGLADLPMVRALEAWGFAPAAMAKPDQIDVSHSYPDRGHGSLFVMAPPPATGMVHFPVRAGRWLREDDTDAVVLNHAALAQAPQLRVGDQVLLSVDTGSARRQLRWRLVGVVEEIGSPGIAYVSQTAFAGWSLGVGSRSLRLATSASAPVQRTLAIQRIEDELLRAGASVESVVPLAELRTAIGDHVKILIDALIAMAVILAIVGMLGLGSAMGTSVVERTRELGIMKTIGATPRQLVGMLLVEGVALAAASSVLAFALSVPLSHAVDGLIGNLGFLAPLPLVLSGLAAALWVALVVGVGYLATVLPARRAARLVIRDALAHV